MKPKILFMPSPNTGLVSATYPLGLAYICAVLKNNNYDVKIIDYSNHPRNKKAFIKYIKNTRHDFIGLSVCTFSYGAVKDMISSIREHNDKAKIIIGGPHVSALPLYSLEDLGADFAIIGEGEWVILELLERIKSNHHNFDDIKGLAFWKDNVPVLNPGCNLIRNLDELPLPAWDLLSFRDYEDVVGQVFFKNKPIAPILTSRGCPHQCSFCASHVTHGRNFRRRSARNVVDEIEFLVKDYGAKEINIYDDTFSEVQEHALGICEEIIRRKLHISWRTAVGLRLDTLNEKLLKVFKDSGCYMLGIGIESFNDEVLAEIKKPIIKAHIENKIDMIHRHGIETVGSFILGLPGDSEDSIRQTIAFAKESKLDLIIFSQAVPYPGSDIFRQKYEKTDLKTIDWSNFNQLTRFPFEISGVPSAKLKTLFSFAYIVCYCKAGRIFKIIKNFLYLRKTKIVKIIKIIRCIARSAL